jgi:hypothetical protein
MMQRIAITLIAASMLVGVAFSQRVSIDHDAVAAYHARMKRVIQSMPIDHGAWTSSEVPIPPSATKLLRPNALIAREYRTQENGGVTATILVVQCADIRDMQGHYPPNCYPAHGWSEDEQAADASFGSLDAVRYEFVRSTGKQGSGITVYNLFVLPSGRVTHSMDAVRKAGADYVVRPYGAAQIQVVINSGVARERHAWVLDEMYTIARPVLDALLGGAQAVGKGEDL